MIKLSNLASKLSELEHIIDLRTKGELLGIIKDLAEYAKVSLPELKSREDVLKEIEAIENMKDSNMEDPIQGEYRKELKRLLRELEHRLAEKSKDELIEEINKLAEDAEVTLPELKSMEDVHKEIEAIEGMMDSMNSENQMDMIRLQELTTRRNEAFEQMTNVIGDLNKSMDEILSNLR
jgi:crotonobetainyl-CoA:carnitine CoA-transferase CaiB-like acyl-CoA transferase